MTDWLSHGFVKIFHKAASEHIGSMWPTCWAMVTTWFFAQSSPSIGSQGDGGLRRYRHVPPACRSLFPADGPWMARLLAVLPKVDSRSPPPVRRASHGVVNSAGLDVVHGAL